MNRRKFMLLGSSSLAIGVLTACAPRGTVDGVAGTPAVTRGNLDAAAFHAKRRFAVTHFGEIAYVERGSGDAALFLHGFPLNGFQWRGALERLSAYRRCIAPDFLGLGYTRVAEGQSVAPEAQVEMLVALMDSLRIASADIVASDSGGGFAQLLAVRHPRRVRSLLLTNCDTEPDCPPDVLLPAIELAREGRFVSEVLAPRLADKSLARLPQGLGGFYTYPDGLEDEVIEMYLAPLVWMPERTHAYMLSLEDNFLAGTESALGRCQAPARIVWGTGDIAFSSDGPDYLDRILGNSRGVRRVSGAKLFFPEEFPDLIAHEARRLWGVACSAKTSVNT